MTGPWQVNWPNCLNARDVDGLPTTGGGHIRTGALIRSDNLDRLTTAGIAAVRAADVRRVVDVRAAWEFEHYPSPFAADPIWRNTPLADVDAPDESDRSLSEQYIANLGRNPDRIAAAIGRIADAPTGCVVVHCHTGLTEQAAMAFRNRLRRAE